MKFWIFLFLGWEEAIVSYILPSFLERSLSISPPSYLLFVFIRFFSFRSLNTSWFQSGWMSTQLQLLMRDFLFYFFFCLSRSQWKWKHAVMFVCWDEFNVPGSFNIEMYHYSKNSDHSKLFEVAITRFFKKKNLNLRAIQVRWRLGLISRKFASSFIKKSLLLWLK